MKVYIYIQSDKVVLLSGMLSTSISVTSEDLTIRYFNEPQPNTVMVSLSTDEFVYLQDQGILITEHLLIN